MVSSVVFLLDTTWCPFLLPPFQKCKHRVYAILIGKYRLSGMSDSNLIAVSNTQKMRTCYLAAPLNTILKEIEKLLVERQIQPIVSADLSTTAITFLEGVVNAISNADLFLAVLSS